MQPNFTCHFCSEPVDPNSPSIFHRATAWFPNKKSGSPALEGPPQGYAHFGCIEIEKRNPIQRQSGSLF